MPLPIKKLLSDCNVLINKNTLSFKKLWIFHNSIKLFIITQEPSLWVGISFLSVVTFSKVHFTIFKIVDALGQYFVATFCKKFSKVHFTIFKIVNALCLYFLATFHTKFSRKSDEILRKPWKLRKSFRDR
jgi:hypothetical protein